MCLHACTKLAIVRFKSKITLFQVIKNRYYCTHGDCLSASGNVRDNPENFSTRNNYFKHFMEHHCRESDLVFTCEICQARFPFQELYKLHIKTKHDKQVMESLLHEQIVGYFVSGEKWLVFVDKTYFWAVQNATG